EVKVTHAVSLQSLDLLDGDTGSNQTPCVRVVIEAVESFRQPARDAGAAAARHAQHLRKARDRQDARHDRRPYSGSGTRVAEADERLDVIKELRDRARGAGIQLALEVVEVELR